MVGANYMGGKRNTIRAKSKDIVGRAQRRHFGKQRLASALRVTREIPTHPAAQTLSSLLPEIAFAHARRDATDSGDTCPEKVFSRHRLYSSTMLNNTPRRDKPSKILGVLDTSDHVSTRAAINHILQQPSLIGINTPNHKDAAYTERTRTPGRPTIVHLDSEAEWLNLQEVDETEHDSDPPLSHSSISRRNVTNLPQDPDTQYAPTEHGSISPPNFLPGTYHVASQDASDDAQLLTETKSLLCAEGNEPERFNIFVDTVHTLPRSSPFPSSSQSSDNLILDLDTSPCAAICAGRSNDPAEDVDCVAALHLVPQPILCLPPRSFHICMGSTGIDDENRTAERDDRRIFLPNNVLRLSSPSESVQILTSQEASKDRGPSDISVDFLSDPHPWETIDRILELKHPNRFANQAAKFNPTKDREGVGYVSPEGSGIRNAHPSGATSFNDEPTDDVRVSSSADCPTTEPEVSTLNNRSTTPDVSYANVDFPPSTRSEVDSNAPVHEGPPIPVIDYTQEKHTQLSTPLAIIVGANSDIDMTFDGPCLFGDSDLEEDE